MNLIDSGNKERQRDIYRWKQARNRHKTGGLYSTRAWQRPETIRPTGVDGLQSVGTFDEWLLVCREVTG